MFFAFSDGHQTVFTNSDGVAEFGTTQILSPITVSYINLFVNGVIQPQTTYQVEEGELTLDESPPLGVPITLQFIIVNG
ncbi:DUF4183 domain-containing protein [Cytobacillus purgationiresistens]|uniref:DUF4183 domain-containing protein n=1 Tax=Cytobacillus purgationiresistens TaxID=863449 RepID=A0ABU0AGE6_9BACI|nr:DUF4183 domain-containing protein [Cytobacillus purgationiresistens]MDQ0270105.1 hypothetical protein [Cytobacillus purgationiresistens]